MFHLWNRIIQSKCNIIITTPERYMMAPLRLSRALMVRPNIQQRTFLGLQRPPPPKPHVMGYLVLQGLAIVLLADLAIATVQNEPTTVRACLQQVGLWRGAPAFERVHNGTASSEVND